jgi:hypothetical protein
MYGPLRRAARPATQKCGRTNISRSLPSTNSGRIAAHKAGSQAGSVKFFNSRPRGFVADCGGDRPRTRKGREPNSGEFGFESAHAGRRATKRAAPEGTARKEFFVRRVSVVALATETDHVAGVANAELRSSLGRGIDRSRFRSRSGLHDRSGRVDDWSTAGRSGTATVASRGATARRLASRRTAAGLPAAE